MCERALGYDGQWDPPIAVTRDGRLWIGLEDGLTATRDGCDLEVFPELDGHTIKDLTTDPRGETLWAITGAPGKKSFVWRRAPGKAFERLAGMDDTNLMTIEVAPSLPSRVYVSGQPYTTIRGRIYRSDDGGATFKTDIGDAGAPGSGGGDGGLVRAPSTSGDAAALLDVGPSSRPTSASGLVADGPFFIGAIDPQDPNRLLIRHLHANGSDLLVTRDGGKTFKNVLSMKSAMFGFAKSGDGRNYWAGSGLPEHGIFRSTDRGEHFEPVSRSGVLCLHSAGLEALFVCQNAFTLGAPAIAVSRDQGKTITSLARFTDIEGPVTCSNPKARANLCTGSWLETKASFSPALDAGDDGDAGRPRRRKRDAGSDATETVAPRSCGCEVVGAVREGGGLPTDLRCLIAGLFPLVLRGRTRRVDGSKLTQRP